MPNDCVCRAATSGVIRGEYLSYEIQLQNSNLGNEDTECCEKELADPKLATEDCNRVLRTSNGQVAIAPAVPPSLYLKQKFSQYIILAGIRTLLKITYAI